MKDRLKVRKLIIILATVAAALFVTYVLHKSYDNAAYCEAAARTSKGSWVKEAGKKYYYGPTGRKAYGIKRIDNEYYYFNPKTGEMMTGWKKINGYKYYFSKKNGAALRGLRVVDHHKRYFDKRGRMVTGWKKIKGDTYYFNPKTGEMAKGFTKIKRETYYFKKGVLQKTGWTTIGDKQYYFSLQDGMVMWGYRVIDGNPYYFDKEKFMLVGCCKEMYNQMKIKKSKTNYLIIVDTTLNATCVYKKGSKSKWTLDKYYRCSPGAPSTPTVKGDFTVYGKGLVFGDTYSAWYYTQFCGNYLFHSVLYQHDSMTSFVDGRIGLNLSHGCVRLKLEDAKWIYDNIPYGTAVYIY